MYKEGYSLFDIIVFFLPILKKHICKIIIFSLLMFIYSAESSIIPFMFGKIINCLEGDSRIFLKPYILLYIISWIAIHVCSRIGEFIAAFLFPKLTEEFTTKLFEVIESNPISFFKNNMTGNILDKTVLDEKVIYDIKNWDTNLSNYDLI